jgi:hypothetical protein
MKPFRVGERFKGNDVEKVVEVRWVDPHDQYCAVVFNVANRFEDETVFATDFLNYWTLIEESDRQSPTKPEASMVRQQVNAVVAA